MARTKQDVATAAAGAETSIVDKTIEGGVKKRGRGRPRLEGTKKVEYVPTGRPRGRPKGSTKKKGAAVLASTTPTKPKGVERRGRPRKSDATTPKSATEAPKSATTTPKRRGRPPKKAAQIPSAVDADANGHDAEQDDAPFDDGKPLSPEEAGDDFDAESPGSEELGEGIDLD